MSQNISEASQARDNRLQQRAARARKVAAGVLPWLLSGCELVLGGIPEKRAADDEGDAATPVDAAQDAGASASDDAADSALRAADAAPDALPPLMPDDAAAAARDAAPTDAAAAPDAQPDAASADGGPDAGAPCGEAVWWYADRDADGYGVSAERSLVCLKPAGSWSLVAGDCNDADERVHPGQLNYFGTPARNGDGSDSFDFDCSGSEEGTGLQTPAPDSCGLLSLTACIGSGYAKTARQGNAVNRLCGSDIQLTCEPAGLLGCTTATAPAGDPYRCR